MDPMLAETPSADPTHPSSQLQALSQSFNVKNLLTMKAEDANSISQVYSMSEAYPDPRHQSNGYPAHPLMMPPDFLHADSYGIESMYGKQSYQSFFALPHGTPNGAYPDESVHTKDMLLRDGTASQGFVRPGFGANEAPYYIDAFAAQSYGAAQGPQQKPALGTAGQNNCELVQQQQQQQPNSRYMNGPFPSRSDEQVEAL